MTMKLSQYAKKNKITYRTAWNHYKRGWIKCEQLPSGTVLVLDDENITKLKTLLYIQESLHPKINKTSMLKQIGY